MSIAGRTLGRHAHVCALFNSRDEQYRVLLPFIRDGLEVGDRVVQCVGRERWEDNLRRLRGARVDAEGAQRTGQWELREAEDTYMPSGEFDQDRMLALVRELLDAGARAGYARTRLVAQPECIFETWRDTNKFVEYEARLNYILPHGEDAVVCIYDCSALGAGVLMDVLRTHELVIFGEVVQENPFYLPPEQFLREWQRRTAPA
jgi:hypothetical protein